MTKKQSTGNQLKRKPNKRSSLTKQKVATAHASALSLAEWTVMVYMAGDNNLAENSVTALEALRKVLTGNLIHVLAQFDPSDPRVATRRMVMNLNSKKHPHVRAIQGRANPSAIARDRVWVDEGQIKFSGYKRHFPKILRSGGYETDTADPKTLFDFVSWTKDNFPASRYMLVLCGHGSGIEEGFLLKDENPAQSMKLEVLEEALDQVKDKLGISLEILGMDSCLMSMAEICLQLHGKAKILVGSQSLTPNPGWPYEQIIQFIYDQGGKVEGKDLAPVIVTKYVNSYVEQAVNTALSTDLSALDLDRSPDLTRKIKDLGRAIKRGLKNSDLDFSNAFKDALVLAHWKAQSYNGELFVDLHDFCDLLIHHVGGLGASNDKHLAEFSKTCEGVRNSIEEMVLATSFCGADYQYSYGVSVYFPWANIFGYYGNLDFAKKTGADWLDFLIDYVTLTRRGQRHRDNQKAAYQKKIASNLALEDIPVKRNRRRVEPIDHGPTESVHSMRNPPITWGEEWFKGLRQK